jgi:DNA repair exonuclease SbcCD nuclease subunit
MNLLIAGDFHLTERDLEECTLVLNEIIIVKNKYNVEKLIITGDTFDRINPSSKELDCFSNFVKEIDIPIILLSANSHESSSQTESIVNHFGILNNMVTVVKQYQDDDYLFIGHFIVNESKKNYGGSVPKKVLDKYKYVVLGHGHSYEVIPKNICQLGAVRYVDFAEVNDKAKIVLLIENYRTESEKLSFLALKSSYPMKDVIVPPVSSGEESEQAKWRLALDSLSPKTKVRLVFSDFSSYINNVNSLQQYKERFSLFQVKKNFLISDKCYLGAKTETVSLKESLEIYLKNNNISEEIKSILLGELS